MDVWVEKASNNLKISIYKKPTNTGSYLNFHLNQSNSRKKKKFSKPINTHTQGILTNTIGKMTNLLKNRYAENRIHKSVENVHGIESNTLDVSMVQKEYISDTN